MTFFVLPLSQFCSHDKLRASPYIIYTSSWILNFLLTIKTPNDTYSSKYSKSCIRVTGFINVVNILKSTYLRSQKLTDCFSIGKGYVHYRSYSTRSEVLLIKFSILYIVFLVLELPLKKEPLPIINSTLH